MPHTAALIPLHSPHAQPPAETTLQASLGGLVWPGQDASALEVIGHGHPERCDIERFIARCFLRSYGATISHFADTLLGVRDSGGRWQAALGYTLPATRAEVFVEQYLDLPLESALSAVLGEPVARGAMAEVGNMAAISAGMGRRLIAMATAHLYARGLDYVVFTATRALANSFSRLGLPVHSVARADPARLKDGEGVWGSYYRNGPTVMVGRIGYGLPLIGLEAA